MAQAPQPSETVDAGVAAIRRAQGLLNAPFTAERKQLILSSLRIACAAVSEAFQLVTETTPDPDPLPARDEALHPSLPPPGEAASQTPQGASGAADDGCLNYWLRKPAPQAPLVACGDDPPEGGRERDDYGWDPEPTTAQLADQRQPRIVAGEPIAEPA